jgi:hypothetical protein
MTRSDWIRIAIGGILAEVAIIAAFVGVAFICGRPIAAASTPVCSFGACFIAAFWVGRRASSRPVMQGVLSSIVAVLIYLALTRARPEPWIYMLAHLCKVLGGASGGWRALALRAAGK